LIAEKEKCAFYFRLAIWSNQIPLTCDYKRLMTKHNESDLRLEHQL